MSYTINWTHYAATEHEKEWWSALFPAATWVKLLNRPGEYEDGDWILQIDECFEVPLKQVLQGQDPRPEALRVIIDHMENTISDSCRVLRAAIDDENRLKLMERPVRAYRGGSFGY